MTGAARLGSTVAELAVEGVDTVDAFCGKCGNLWQAPISFLPPATTLGKIAELMACPVCSGRNIEIRASIQTASRWMQ